MNMNILHNQVRHAAHANHHQHCFNNDPWGPFTSEVLKSCLRVQIYTHTHPWTSKEIENEKNKSFLPVPEGARLGMWLNFLLLTPGFLWSGFVTKPNKEDKLITIRNIIKDTLKFFCFFFATLEGAAAAATKSLQSCPTLCDPIDGSPSGSPVPGILQARTLEWVVISFSNAWKWKVKVKSLSCVQLCY